MVLCSDVTFEQKRKRRRLYREPSVSPVIIEQPSESPSYSSSLLWKSSGYDDVKLVSSLDDDQRSKVRFLRLLGLEQAPRLSRTRKFEVDPQAVAEYPN